MAWGEFLPRQGQRREQESQVLSVTFQRCRGLQRKEGSSAFQPLSSLCSYVAHSLLVFEELQLGPSFACFQCKKKKPSQTPKLS